MKERLNDILKHFKINASQFADQIGVQRASVSHVLSGRNKPGFDFIQKIIDAYPTLSAEWLITGRGDILKSRMSRQDLFFESEIIGNEPVEEIIKSRKTLNQKSVNDIEQGNKTLKARNIEKIIVFYSDKSFEEYFKD